MKVSYFQLLPILKVYQLHTLIRPTWFEVAPLFLAIQLAEPAHINASLKIEMGVELVQVIVLDLRVHEHKREVNCVYRFFKFLRIPLRLVRTGCSQ